MPMNAARSPIVVVSGVPRSGTSLMMQMLRAGGMAAMTDDLRSADDDNPRGYLEFERVKQLRNDKAWLDDAEGKAVKIIHMLLAELPPDREYRVIFMRRNLEEVVRSQAKMLEGAGKRGAALAPEKLIAVFQAQIRQAESWMASNAGFQRLDVEYGQVIASPRVQAERVAAFLGTPLNIDAMIEAVDPALHRNRAASGG